MVTSRLGRRLAAIAVTCILLGGCGMPTETKKTTFVVGATATANEPAVSLSGAPSDLIEKSVKTDVVLLSAYVGSAVNEPLLPDKDISVYFDSGSGEIEANEGALRKGFEKNIAEVNKKLAAAASSEPDLDLLGLLGTLALRPGPATLLVISSGLQTKGPLDLRNMGSEIDVEATLARLDEKDIPKLSEKKVVFIGLGQVKGPQAQLTERMQKSVRELWLKVCRKAGGECDSNFLNTTGGAPAATIAVPTIPVQGEPSIVVSGASTRIEIPNGSLFYPNSSEFLPGASATLDKITGHFLPNGDTEPESATAVGHTATWGKPEGAVTTSKQRAVKVVDYLVHAGVERSLFRQVDGVGFNDLIVTDLDGEGNLIPAAAERNRTVVLTVVHRRRS